MPTSTKESPYVYAYPGTPAMVVHDGESDMRRWFRNYATDKNAFFFRTEWLTVEEEHWFVRGKRVTRYVGTIGSDDSPMRRRVTFETSAPPPPTFMQPATEKPVKFSFPPGYFDKIARELLRQDMMRALKISYPFTPQQRFVAEVLPPVAPPPPKYRRNV